MAVDIHDNEGSVSREQVIAAVEALGLIATDLTELTITNDMVAVTEVVRNDRGGVAIEGDEFKKRTYLLKVEGDR